MKNYNLFLDDIRDPLNMQHMSHVGHYIKYYQLLEWIVVRNYNEFVKCINERGIPDVVSFDHDLAQDHYVPSRVWGTRQLYEEYVRKNVPKEKTGMDCARYLFDFCAAADDMPSTVLVHSMNPYGSENIKAYWEQFKRYMQNKSTQN